jgi:glycosyltransferase involved in cell wall biosynthesis
LADRPLVVAINAQIDPETPGGTETNVVSLLRHLGATSASERFVVLAASNGVPGLTPWVQGPHALVRWPFPELGYIPLAPRWARLRIAAGELAPAFDALHRWWRARRGASNASARQADPVLRAHGISIVHFPYAVYFDTQLPFLYEPWDLQHRHFPEFFSAAEWAWRDRLYRKACRRAAYVVTASRWVKRDIVSQYGIAPDRVAVVPRGSCRQLRPLPPAERATAWARHDLPAGFAFYPAMTFPHKNHLRLLQALARLRHERGHRLPLVCTGRIVASHWPVIQSAIAELGLNDQVRFLGPVSDALQASLYDTARFVVFPSLFEGLGLPLLEAMDLRVPVVASDATCIPEIVGGDAILFDGGSVDAMVEALATAVARWGKQRMRVSSSPALTRFSWSQAMQTFIALYRTAAAWPVSNEQRQMVTEATGA